MGGLSMGEVLGFIKAYQDIIVFLLGWLIFFLINPAAFREQFTQAMLIAKKMAHDGILQTGKEQEDWIVDNFDKFLDARYAWIARIIPETFLRATIKYLYDKVFSEFEKENTPANEGAGAGAAGEAVDVGGLNKETSAEAGGQTPPLQEEKDAGAAAQEQQQAGDVRASAGAAVETQPQARAAGAAGIGSAADRAVISGEGGES